MKRSSTVFLQVVVVLIGIGTLALLLWEPHLEGRNAHATTFEIYFKDSFLAYAYISSLTFFTILYQAFKSLGYVRKNNTFSEENVKALRIIKYSAIIQSLLIVMAAVYIRVFHAKDDDPAGFIALCIAATFISIVIASAGAIFERILQNAVNIKSENDLTI